MDMIKEAIVEWLREILVGGIVSNLSGLFDSTNERVAEIAGQVGTTPMAWNSSIYNMVHSLSESVIMPIAGVILAFVMTLELIQLITEKNNLNDVDTWMFFKWIFKSACAVLIVSKPVSDFQYRSPGGFSGTQPFRQRHRCHQAKRRGILSLCGQRGLYGTARISPAGQLSEKYGDAVGR